MKLIFISIISLLACNNEKQTNKNSTELQNIDSATTTTTNTSTVTTNATTASISIITALDVDLPPGSYVFRSKYGNNFVMNVGNGVDSHVSELLANPPCQSDYFDGTDRIGVKTSASNAPIQKNVDVERLFEFLMNNEANYCQTQSFNLNQRAPLENRNVEFNIVYLYTYKRLGDEDYRLIVGTTDNIQNAFFFTAEISGIPQTDLYGKKIIVKARTDFEEYFQIRGCRSSFYKNDFRQTPIPIKLRGSLFFDKEQCQSFEKNGPKKWIDIKLSTAWEIHPVTLIQFLE